MTSLLRPSPQPGGSWSRLAARPVRGVGPRAEWWRHAVIYHVYPRSFVDSNGDGIGDLPGITARLGYIAALGADAIWLSPFYPSPLADGGYDVAGYCDVDPLFGTLADFDRLLGRAHRLGLRVLVDLVPNHTSDQHPWFQAALAAGPAAAAVASSRRTTGFRSSAARPGPGSATSPGARTTPGSGTCTCSTAGSRT